MSMDRREAIKRTAYIMGGLVFAPSALGVLKGCRARPSLDWNPELFSADQAHLVSVLSDVILPADDTPGASEVGVPAFIEDMVNDVYTEENRNLFLDGLNAFEEEAREHLGGPFVDATSEEQFEFAEGKNREAIEVDVSSSESGPSFFLIFKELTMLGYFTSEVGATQVLRYEAVPGRYDGCIPFDEVGRTWAT